MNKPTNYSSTPSFLKNHLKKFLGIWDLIFFLAYKFEFLLQRYHNENGI